MKKGSVIFLLVLLVSFFSFLGFRRINEQEILYHDAGCYLLEAKFIDEALQMLGSLRPGAASEPDFWERISTETADVPPHHGKPGFDAIVWLAGKFFGFHDTLTAKVTMVFAIVNLFLTFFLARRLYSIRTGIYAVAVLVSSLFFLVYARSGLPEQAATSFFLIGIFLYLRSKENPSKIWIYLTGLSLGSAFACNHWRTGYMPLVILGLDLLTTGRENRGGRKWLGRAFFLTLGYLTPIVPFQLLYWLIRLVIGPLPFPDYIEQLVYKSEFGYLVWFQRIHMLGLIFWKVEGPLFVASVLSASVFLLIRSMRRRKFQDLAIPFISVIPFVYFSSFQWLGETLPRTVSSLLPIFSIGIGELASAIQQKIRIDLTVVVVVLILALSFPRNLKAGITRSGYAEASRYLQSEGEGKPMILAWEPVWRFYLGKQGYRLHQNLDSLEAVVERARKEDVGYLALDNTALYSKQGRNLRNEIFQRGIEPAAKFHNPRGKSFEYLLDEHGIEKYSVVAEAPWTDYILVFKIKDIEDKLKERENAESGPRAH